MIFVEERNTKKTKTRILDELKAGLEDSIAFSQGEFSLVTTTIPTPPPKREPTQIADLRHSLCMSQAVFAAVINVSPKTVQSWEQGVRKPSQAALRMLEVIDEDPGVVKIIMTPKPRPTPRELGHDEQPWRVEALESGLGLSVPVPQDPADLVRELDAAYEASLPEYVVDPLEWTE